MRRVAHLDMDAFFVSVELLRYPQLRGQPVVVGGAHDYEPIQQSNGQFKFFKLGDYTGRGVVTTSTYEARALGVFSGMGLMKCGKLTPEIILLPSHFDNYRHYSRLFKEAVRAIAPNIEEAGIDEIYIDLTDLPEETILLVKRIKEAILNATGLTCSIGVSPNKLLSKISSEFEKPNGLTILDEGDVPHRIWPLPAKKINGIGPKTAERLIQMGVHTIGELAAMSVITLIDTFGRATGNWLHQVAQGLDDRPVANKIGSKSISRETTFERDLHVRQDRSLLSESLFSLCQRVANDLEQKGYACRTIGIKLRYQNFETVTRDLTLPHFIYEPLEIREAARECLKRISWHQKIRLLGIRASGLIPINEIPLYLSIQPSLPF